MVPSVVSVAVVGELDVLETLAPPDTDQIIVAAESHGAAAVAVIANGVPVGTAVVPGVTVALTPAIVKLTYPVVLK